jgi:hypothetical protein
MKNGTLTLSTLSVIFCMCPPGTSEAGCIASPGDITAPLIRTKPGQSMLMHPVASLPSLCNINGYRSEDHLLGDDFYKSRIACREIIHITIITLPSIVYRSEDMSHRSDLDESVKQGVQVRRHSFDMQT